MKGKNLVKIIFVSIGFLGLILLIFGTQFNGTLCDDIQKVGYTCLGIFGVWGIISIIDAYISQKELENM